MRFAHGRIDHASAVASSTVLFRAAAAAGIQRIVHVSITHADPESPYPYFRGKAAVEEQLASTGISHAIVRPAVLFGGNDVLVNNIAWLLRRLPVFGIGDGGGYRLRPVHVDDLAALMVSLGASTDTTVTDAVGPESLTFREMVTAIRAAVGSRALLVPVPGRLLPVLSRGLGLVLRDTLLTPDEYQAMAAGLADSPGPATGTTVFTDWVAAHGPDLGTRYASELDRHFRAGSPPGTAA